MRTRKHTSIVGMTVILGCAANLGCAESVSVEQTQAAATPNTPGCEGEACIASAAPGAGTAFAGGGSDVFPGIPDDGGDVCLVDAFEDGTNVGAALAARAKQTLDQLGIEGDYYELRRTGDGPCEQGEGACKRFDLHLDLAAVAASAAGYSSISVESTALADPTKCAIDYCTGQALCAPDANSRGQLLNVYSDGSTTQHAIASDTMELGLRFRSTDADHASDSAVTARRELWDYCHSSKVGSPLETYGTDLMNESMAYLIDGNGYVGCYSVDLYSEDQSKEWWYAVTAKAEIDTTVGWAAATVPKCEGDQAYAFDIEIDVPHLWVRDYEVWKAQESGYEPYVCPAERIPSQHKGHDCVLDEVTKRYADDQRWSTEAFCQVAATQAWSQAATAVSERLGPDYTSDIRFKVEQATAAIVLAEGAASAVIRCPESQSSCSLSTYEIVVQQVSWLAAIADGRDFKVTFEVPVSHAEPAH